MKVYLVGGACRDLILGLEPKDFDFVVVGSSPEEMIEQGYESVGADFPVFLHPDHGWELALARIERKIDVGYTGFDSDWKGVTLEQDLERRDLTVNAIAAEVNWDLTQKHGEPVILGDWVDPFNGIKDINSRKLRPVSYHFKEDPLRCLRAARFLAKYPFTFTTELLEACKEASKELHSVSRERIWVETEKALLTGNFLRYISFINTFKDSSCDIFEEVFGLEEVCMKNEFHQEDHALMHTYMVVGHADKHFKDPEITFAAMMHDVGKLPCFLERQNLHGHEGEGIPIVEAFCRKYKVPNKYRDLALITTKQHLKVHNILGRGKNAAARPKSIMKLFEETSALSKPERFKKMLKACESDAKGRIGKAANDKYIQRQYLEGCLQAVLDFNTKDLSKQLLSEGKSGIIIGQKIREERIRVIRQVKNKWEDK